MTVDRHTLGFWDGLKEAIRVIDDDLVHRSTGSIVRRKLLIDLRNKILYKLGTDPRPNSARDAYEDAARVVDYQRGRAEEFNGDDDFNDARNYESALKNAAEELRRRAAKADPTGA